MTERSDGTPGRASASEPDGGGGRGRTPRAALSRQCARPGCSQQASATLTYHYGHQAAWLERLAAESHPMAHDLCDAHADRLSVPQGWRLEDRRVVASFVPRVQEQLAS